VKEKEFSMVTSTCGNVEAKRGRKEYEHLPRRHNVVYVLHKQESSKLLRRRIKKKQGTTTVILGNAERRRLFSASNPGLIHGAQVLTSYLHLYPNRVQAVKYSLLFLGRVMYVHMYAHTQQQYSRMCPYTGL
jgi:hypothetical protein